MNQEQNDATHLWPHSTRAQSLLGHLRFLACKHQCNDLQYQLCQLQLHLPSKFTKPFTNALEIYIDNRDRRFPEIIHF